MKTLFIATLSLVLMAGIPLTASAKSGELFQRERMVANDHQDGGQIILAAAGKTQSNDSRFDSDSRRTGSFGWLAGRYDRYGHYNGGDHDDHGGDHDDHGSGHDDDDDASLYKPHRQ